MPIAHPPSGSRTRQTGSRTEQPTTSYERSVAPQTRRELVEVRRLILRRIASGLDVDPAHRAEAEKLVRRQLRLASPWVTALGLLFWAAMAALGAARGNWSGVAFFAAMATAGVAAYVHGQRFRRWEQKYMRP